MNHAALALVLAALLVPGFRGHRYTRAEVRAMVAAYRDWPVERVTSTFLCESHGFEGAASPTHDAGLTQINRIWWRGPLDVLRLLTDARYAVARAHELWLSAGLSAWTCAVALG